MIFPNPYLYSLRIYDPFDPPIIDLKELMAQSPDMALIVATDFGDLEIVRQLLAGNLSLFSIHEALCYAASSDKIDILKLLLKDERCDPTMNDCEALQSAIGWDGGSEAFSILLNDERVDPSVLPDESLFELIYLKSDKDIQTLMNHPRFQKRIIDCSLTSLPFFPATDETVNSLLQSNLVDLSLFLCRLVKDEQDFEYIDAEVWEKVMSHPQVQPDAEDNKTIKYAVNTKSVELVDLLLNDKRVNPSVDDHFAVRNAIKKGNLQIIERFLCDNRVDPSACNNEGLKYHWNKALYSLRIIDRLLQDKRVAKKLSKHRFYKEITSTLSLVMQNPLCVLPNSRPQ